MHRLFALVLAASALAPAGCKKDDKPNPSASLPAAPVGVRRIDIDVGQDGYKPDRIAGKPGEKLGLVFTRTFEADCISQVKAPDGKMYALPLNKPTEVAVTVPQSGELGFACGMDMYHGVVVAQP